MNIYRTYFYNDAGIVSFVHRIECQDDAGAIAAMGILLDGTDYRSAELWHLGRRVEVLQRSATP